MLDFILSFDLDKNLSHDITRSLRKTSERIPPLVKSTSILVKDENIA